MSLRTRLHSWLRSITHRRRFEREVEEELHFHLEARAADLMRQGLDTHEAIRQARLEFGTTATHKDRARHNLGLRWLDELAGDLRYATRILRKSPSFTAIAIGSLALAIGANTTIFSVANELLFSRLAVPHAEELRVLKMVGIETVVRSVWGGNFDQQADGRYKMDSFAYPVYEHLKKDNKVLEELFAFKDVGRENITVRGEAQPAQVQLVSGNFYTQMQVRPQLGRLIDIQDDAVPGAGAVAVISDGMWTRVFGRSSDVIGQMITVDTAPVTIIGVNPRGFTGAQGAQTSPELFMPLSMIPILRASPEEKDESILIDKEIWWLQVMARRKVGVSDVQAEAALNTTINAILRKEYAEGMAKTKRPQEMVLEDGSRGMNFSGHEFAQPVYVLMALVGLVLLLACANIANLLLARAASRQREMNVRMALGAGRMRILRQVLTESLMLSAAGGVFGLLLGYAGRNALPRLMMNAWERRELNVPFDWRVFGFALGLTLLTGLLFGAAPMWGATRTNVSGGLKESAATATRRRRGWSGRTVVAIQVTLSMLLVTGAALFLRTLVNLNTIKPGFRTKNLILFDLSAPNKRYKALENVALHKRIEEALSAVPGVEQVGTTTVPYVAGYMMNSTVLVEGEEKKANEDGSNISMMAQVGDRFLRVMDVPILRGRNFNAQDTETSTPVVIVNEAFAKKYFHGHDAIGKRFSAAGRPTVEVIGICADTRYGNLRDAPPPVHYDLFRQQKSVKSMTYVVRTRLPQMAIVPAIRRVVQSIDRDIPLIDIRTQKEQMDATMQQERLFASLTVGFGILALALACVGIYGIMAYTVSQRTNEIGIRLTLGARRDQVRRMVLREAGWLAVIGVGIGLGAALMLARLVKTMLYGLQPTDPVSLAGAACLLLTVALIAGWIPAARAARVEPMEALRHE